MTVDKKTNNNKIRLWTRQHENVINELKENGIYRVKKEYIQEKMDTISDYYLNLYDWYVSHAEKIVPRPEGVSYPIWFSTSSDLMLQPIENTVILELEVDREKVIITDTNKWGYVVNYFYLPIDKEDEQRHNEELRKYGIGDESALIMSHKGNFYPLLKNKIIRSWERLFESCNEKNPLSQATMWEIKAEWVKDVIHG